MSDNAKVGQRVKKLEQFDEVDPNAGANVVDLTLASTRVERAGSVASGKSKQKVAVLAHWSPTPKLSLSVKRLVEELMDRGYAIVVSSTCESSSPLEFGPDPIPAGITVVRRPNIGYDFGSWAVCLEMFPQIRGVSHVLLINDSMVGPFDTIADVLEDFEDSQSDVWGLTESTQFGVHLQSFAIGFRFGVLDEKPLRQFWRGICVQESKSKLIFKYEIGLSRLIRRSRMSSRAYFPERSVVSDQTNPTIFGWQRLIHMGLPMVKRELVQDFFVG